jgi:hypothetical protein
MSATPRLGIVTDAISGSHQMRQRTPSPSPSRRPSVARVDADAITGGITGAAPARLLLLQRAVGNRATRQLLVQRCGSTPADQCGCHGGDHGPSAAPPAAAGPEPTEATPASE